MNAQLAAERFLASPAFAETTRRAYRTDVEEFCRWLGAGDLETVDVRTLVEYVGYLGSARGGRGKLAPASISRKLAAVRAFLRHSLGSARVPDARLAPRRGRRLPDAPRRADVDKELAALEGEGPLPLRNRALVELVYSAGLRSAEAKATRIGSYRSARRRGCGWRVISTTPGPSSFAARTTRCFCRRPASVST